jgi:hypothetical protein
MKRKLNRFAVFVAAGGLFFLPGGGGAQAANVEVATADGERRQGVLTALGEEKPADVKRPFALRVDEQDLASDLVLQVTLLPKRTTTAPVRVFRLNLRENAATVSATVAIPDVPDAVCAVLRDGGSLLGAPQSGDAKNFKLLSASLGEQTLSNQLLAALVFAKAAGVEAAERTNFLETAPPEGDVLLTVKGERIEGFFDGFDEKGLVMESGGRKRTTPVAEAALLRFAALGEVKPPAHTQIEVELTDGSRLRGRPAGLQAAALRLLSGSGATWLLPLDKMVGFSVSGGRVVYLSDMEPTAAAERSLAVGMPVVFRWRRDANAKGESLRPGLGLEVARRGLGVHAHAALTYALDARFTRFLCLAGMDADAPAGVKCAYQVFGDEPTRPLAAGVATAGTAATPLNVDVTGVKRLTLVCTFGADNDDTGALFDWAEARLISQTE